MLPAISLWNLPFCCLLEGALSQPSLLAPRANVSAAGVLDPSYSSLLSRYKGFPLYDNSSEGIVVPLENGEQIALVSPLTNGHGSNISNQAHHLSRRQAGDDQPHLSQRPYINRWDIGAGLEWDLLVDPNFAANYVRQAGFSAWFLRGTQKGTARASSDLDVPASNATATSSTLRSNPFKISHQGLKLLLVQSAMMPDVVVDPIWAKIADKLSITFEVFKYVSIAQVKYKWQSPMRFIDPFRRRYPGSDVDGEFVTMMNKFSEIVNNVEINGFGTTSNYGSVREEILLRSDDQNREWLRQYTLTQEDAQDIWIFMGQTKDAHFAVLDRFKEECGPSSSLGRDVPDYLKQRYINAMNIILEIQPELATSTTYAGSDIIARLGTIPVKFVPQELPAPLELPEPRQSEEARPGQGTTSPKGRKGGTGRPGRPREDDEGGRDDAEQGTSGRRAKKSDAGR